LQPIHPEFDTWFPGHGHKVISSDSFLKRETFIDQVQRLKDGATIVIIGGSHSGFSCAWMLLNGAAEKAHNISSFA
jgi:hypothetical protein